MKNILIVEDERIIALEYKMIAERNGYFVNKIVDNGKDAIEAAVENNPDFILMDINIKGPMNGIEAAKEIFKRHILSTIIFITAYDISAFVFPEFKYFLLNKPLIRNSLLSILSS